MLTLRFSAPSSGGSSDAAAGEDVAAAGVVCQQGASHQSDLSMMGLVDDVDLGFSVL